MNRFRPFILIVTVVLSAFVAYGLWTMPKPQPADSEGFSSARVAADIEVISKEHHSVAQPQERALVRDYLIGRLKEIGADTVKVFRHDSLTGPQNKHVVYTFDAYNVIAEFSPQKESSDTTYLMLVAHYDSRYSQPVLKDTVWSYGAADNGYGVGVALETVSQLMKKRAEWTQGVKVLFTDAEEVGMMGMKALWEEQRDEFDDVGLLVNIEARGPWGPALLFEACPGNRKVMDLYRQTAEYPYTYSLTTVVYGFMPNFTDFTIVKDHIPGLNFSTVADINHYHTDLDNFSNISERSIQHYGEQILPLTQKYVTSDEYSDRNALYAESDAVNFTVPLLGMFNFSKTVYIIFNVVVFILFLLLFGLEGVRGRIKARKVFKNSCVVLLAAIGMLALGELVAFVSAWSVGAKFKPFGIVMGISFDNVVMIAATAFFFLLAVIIYISMRIKTVRQVSGSMRASAAINAASRFAYGNLYGTMALMFFLSIVLQLTINENFMFLIPLLCAVAGMILYHLTSMRFWLLAAMVPILLHAFSFLYALAMALTIGAYGAVIMFAFIDIMLLLPLADIYLMPVRRK